MSLSLLAAVADKDKVMLPDYYDWSRFECYQTDIWIRRRWCALYWWWGVGGGGGAAAGEIHNTLC
jgi:hypothetical protein